MKVTIKYDGISKIANLLDNTSNQPSKFTAKNWVEINDESRGRYSVNKQINFKTSVLKSTILDKIFGTK